jgi:hypothetical protein
MAEGKSRCFKFLTLTCPPLVRLNLLAQNRYDQRNFLTTFRANLKKEIDEIMMKKPFSVDIGFPSNFS